MEYLKPGYFMPEVTYRSYKSIDIQEFANKAPNNSYGFTYKIKITTKRKGKTFTRYENPDRNIYYINAKIIEYSDDLDPERKAKLNNICEKKIIECNIGNWQPLTDRSKIIKVDK